MMGWIGAIWEKFAGFPELLTSEYAIKVYGQGHVVAHNYLAHWHDAIDVATYGNPDGAPNPVEDRLPVSIDVDYDSFINVSMPDKTDPQRLYKPDGLDFRLKSGAAAIDAGIELPSITDGFTGKAPDIGAFETGRPVPQYGPRN